MSNLVPKENAQHLGIERELLSVASDLHSSTIDGRSLVDQILRHIRIVTKTQAVHFFRRSKKDCLIAVAVDSNDPEDTAELARCVHSATTESIAASRIFFERLLSTGGPTELNLMDNVVRQAMPRASMEWHDLFGAKWALFCPMMAGNRAVGLLCLRTCDPSGFSDATKIAAQTYAHQLALLETTETRHESELHVDEEDINQRASIPRLFAAIGDAFNYLLSDRDFERGLRCSVETLGKGMNIDRIYVGRQFIESDQWMITAEWHRDVSFYSPKFSVGSHIDEVDFPNATLPLVSYRPFAANEPKADSGQRIGDKFEDPPQILSELVLPIIVDSVTCGCIGFQDSSHSCEWSEPEIEVLRMVAQVVASATQRAEVEKIHAERLAAERILAFERRVMEQERFAVERARQFSHANKVLVKSLESFTSDVTPDAFMDLMLTKLARALEVPMVELWYGYEDENRLYPGPCFYADKMIDPEASENPLASSGLSRPKAFVLNGSDSGLEEWICEPLSDCQEIPSELAQWYDSTFAVQKLIGLPLVVGHQLIGAVFACAPKGHQHLPSQVELAQSLAIQLGLIMQMERLTERDRTLAMVQERTRMAREIHDTLAQGFVAVLQQFQSILTSIDSEPALARKIAERGVRLARNSLEEARQAVKLLRDHRNVSSDLLGRLEQLVDDENDKGFPTVRFESSLSNCEESQELADQVMRIVSEAIQNARNHSKSQSIAVRLFEVDRRRKLEVQDYGIGFDTGTVREGRFGLVGMKERAATVNAALEIHSTVGKGTTVVVSWAIESIAMDLEN